MSICHITNIGWCSGHQCWCERLTGGWSCPLSGQPFFDDESEIGRLRAEVSRLIEDNRRLLDERSRVTEALWRSVDLDPEHTIDCHADTLPAAYLEAVAQLDKAREILSDDVEARAAMKGHDDE